MKKTLLRVMVLALSVSLSCLSCKKPPVPPTDDGKEEAGPGEGEPGEGEETGDRDKEKMAAFSLMDGIGVYSADFSPLFQFDADTQEIRYRVGERRMIVQNSSSLAQVLSLTLSAAGDDGTESAAIASDKLSRSVTVKEIKRDGDLVWLWAVDGSCGIIALTHHSGLPEGHESKSLQLKVSSPGGDSVPTGGSLGPATVTDTNW